jgi:hypothetical protein
MEDNNKKLKSFPEVEEALKNTHVSVEGTYVPILTKTTEHIIINCNAGNIIDIKPTLRFR